MDTFFFHPKIVHIPIALSVLMPLIAGGLLVAWWRNWLSPRGWVVAVLLQAVLMVGGIAALQSGEAQEELVEKVVAEKYIEEHEEAAEVFVWASGAVLGLMLLGLATSRGRAGLAFGVASVLGTLVVTGLGYRTGEAGGALVYRHGAVAAYADAGTAALPSAVEALNEYGEHEEDEEEDDD